MSGGLIGIDEAGRGCWAGPLVVAAVSGRAGSLSFAVDSKSVSHKQRLELASQVFKQADEIGVGFVSARYIDSFGLSAALTRGAGRAFSSLSKTNLTIVIDGPHDFLKLEGVSVRTLIKADSSVKQVSAASIVAKVIRDRWMTLAAAANPGWGFEKHKGYGTELHNQRLELLGVSPLHRLSVKPVGRVYDSAQYRQGPSGRT